MQIALVGSFSAAKVLCGYGILLRNLDQLEEVGRKRFVSQMKNYRMSCLGLVFTYSASIPFSWGHESV